MSSLRLVVIEECVVQGKGIGMYWEGKYLIPTRLKEGHVQGPVGQILPDGPRSDEASLLCSFLIYRPFNERSLAARFRVHNPVQLTSVTLA